MDATKFDAYELAAVLPAGVVTGAGSLWLFSIGGDAAPAHSLGADLTAAGMLLILAFVTGQLIHAVSSWFERYYWKRVGGWPTDRVESILTASQLQRFAAKFQSTFKADYSIESQKKSDGTWSKWVREIYVRVKVAELSGRVDMFNRSYGMFSSLCLSSLILAVLSAVALFHHDPQKSALFVGLLGALSVLASYIFFHSMRAAGFNYGRELFLTFMALPKVD